MSEVTTSEESLSDKPASITEGRIVFLLVWTLCLGAAYSLCRWNHDAATALVTAFVMVAQLCLKWFFQNPMEDPGHTAVVLMCAVGYCLLFSVSLILWNVAISGELIGGFSLFVLKIAEEYFGQKPAVPTNAPETRTETTKGVES